MRPTSDHPSLEAIRRSHSAFRHSSIRRVGLALGIGIFLMPYIFSWFTLRPGYSRTSKILSFGWLGLILMVAVLASKETRNTFNSTSDSISSPPGRSETNAHVALLSFRDKLTSVPEAHKLISEVEFGGARGALRIHVTNEWFNFQKHQKRQLTVSLINLWRQELGSDIVHVSVYDRTGHEVASQTFTGSVWIEDE